jgi:thioredoxin 1
LVAEESGHFTGSDFAAITRGEYLMSESHSSAVRHLTDAEVAEVVLSPTAGPVVVDFWAPWCPPCRAIGPFLDKLAGDFQGRLTIAKINVDDHNQFAGQLGVQGIPAIYLFNNGEQVDTFTGSRPYGELKSTFEQFLAGIGANPAQTENSAAETAYQSAIEAAEAAYDAVVDPAREVLETHLGPLYEAHETATTALDARLTANEIAEDEHLRLKGELDEKLRADGQPFVAAYKQIAGPAEQTRSVAFAAAAVAYNQATGATS